MNVLMLFIPGLAIRSYVIIDDSTKNAAVIDPTRMVGPILTHLTLHQAKLVYILETHVHADFISGAKELKYWLDGKPQICCSSMGGKSWVPHYADVGVHDKDEFDLGQLKIQAWHTPGHTPEHMMYILYSDGRPKTAFTGDFLFAGSVGRPDLLGEDQVEALAGDLYQTIFDVLPALPDDLRILSAHGAGSLCGKGIKTVEETSLGIERSINPALQKEEKVKWMHHLLQDMPQAARYFPLMKRMNVQGVPLLKDLASPKRYEPIELAKMDLSQYYLLDVRNQELFAKGHIKGSVNIPWGTTFSRWIGEFVSYETPIIVIANSPNESYEAISTLHLVGLDRLAGFVVVDQEFETLLANKIQTFEMLAGYELLQHLDEVEVIDVRTNTEWNGGRIPGAKHFELNNFPQVLKQLAKDTTLAFVCGSGIRASIAASLARKEGLEHVCNIKGGMRAWSQAGLPIEKSIKDQEDTI